MKKALQISILASMSLLTLSCSKTLDTEIVPLESNNHSSARVAALQSSYDASWAVKYVYKNLNVPYNSKTDAYEAGKNPYIDGEKIGNAGGNCTNFAGQAILAGLIKKDDILSVWNNRNTYNIDKTVSPNSSLRWFYESSSSRGVAWTSANSLYQYADKNKSTYKGIHFQKITFDTPTSFMDYKSVKVGDIIFADWEGDKTIDHTMIVTQKYDGGIWDTLRGYSGYNRIRVSYQSIIRQDKGLGDINETLKYKALFYVYRPIDYNSAGL